MSKKRAWLPKGDGKTLCMDGYPIEIVREGPNHYYEIGNRLIEALRTVTPDATGLSAEDVIKAAARCLLERGDAIAVERARCLAACDAALEPARKHGWRDAERVAQDIRTRIAEPDAIADGSVTARSWDDPPCR